MEVTVMTGDVLTVELEGMFHAVLCDPPYELGFMGKDWDKSGIAFDPETWRKISEHLYPGAFIMAFASSRGWHRLACAIEDAGFVIHPTIFGWAFGSGFPKATRIDTQIDKAGAATELAKAWVGHRYGLQAMKPAVEPIIVAQKPYKGKPVTCITKTGAGALNIDGSRIGTDDRPNREPDRGRITGNSWQGGIDGSLCGNKANGTTSQGRWPSNLILYHLPECRQVDDDWECAPGCPVATLDAQSGGASRFFFQVQDQLDDADPIFYQAKAARKERDAGLEEMPVVINADLTGGDRNRENARAGTNRNGPLKCRNTHPTVKPIALAKYLATLLLPPVEYGPRRLYVPFAGTASEMIGAMQAGWEEIIGVDKVPEHVMVAEKRIKYHAALLPVRPVIHTTEPVIPPEPVVAASEPVPEPTEPVPCPEPVQETVTEEVEAVKPRSLLEIVKAMKARG